MNNLSKYSDKQLKCYRVIILTCGMLIIFLSILLLFVDVFFGLILLILGLLAIKVTQTYKTELKRRESERTRPTIERTNESLNCDSSDIESFLPTVDNVQVSPKHITEHYNIAGTSYRQKQIKELGEENLDYGMSKAEIVEYFMYDEKIYQLSFSPDSVVLEEEPDNEHDPNAIKVLIDNVHVGYIKKENCLHVKNLINECKIKSISADVHGGKYKIVNSDYDFNKDKDIYELEKGETDFFVSIDITLK